MTETTPDVAVGEPDESVAPREPRTGLLVALALGWLAVVLGIAHFLIADGTQLALVSAAIALPTVVAASLLAAAAVGLAVVSWLARRGVTATRDRLRRIALAAVPGLVTGGLAGSWLLLTWQVPGTNAALAVTLALAAGAAAGLAAATPRAVAAAGVAATLAVFVAGFVINFLLRDWLMGVFGASASAASQYAAFQWFAPTAAALSALVGGLLAFWRLRRLRSAAIRWPSYLSAGAWPGGMLLLAEVITGLGGARLLGLAGSSEPDSAAFAWDGDARLNHALVVLFLGGMIAMIAFGRTLPGRVEADVDTEADVDNEAEVETGPDPARSGPRN